MPKQAIRLLEDPHNNEKDQCYKQKLIMLFCYLPFSFFFFWLYNEKFEKDITPHASTQKPSLTSRG